MKKAKQLFYNFMVGKAYLVFAFMSAISITLFAVRFL